MPSEKSGSPSRRFFLAGSLAAAQAVPSRAAAASIPLRYRTLGKTGLRVTEVGHGSEAVSDSTVLSRSADMGINFFDTAHAYQGGNNEQVLGQALAGRRSKVVLASRSYARNANDARRDLDESLRTLRTDFLDIWYLGRHNEPETLTDELLAVQQAAQKAGKIRFRGLSTHRLRNMQSFILERGKFDVIQIPYNFSLDTPKQTQRSLDIGGADQFLDRMKQAGIGVVAMKVMAGSYRRSDGQNARAVAVASIRWALRNDRIQTTSIRMADVDMLVENVQAMAAAYSPADEKLIATQMASISPVFCRMCGACDGQCPRGLPTADLVRFVTYAEGYGRPEMGAAAFHALPHPARQTRCSDCGSCPVQCPNGVEVRRQVSRAQTLFA